MQEKFYKTHKITTKAFWVNFWEYYKYYVLTVVVIGLVAAVGIGSYVGRERYDLTVTYLGENTLLTPAKFKLFLEENTEDTDGNGEKNVNLSNNPLSEDENVEKTIVMLNRMDADLLAADPFIMMTDDEFIGRFVNMSALEPLDELVEGKNIPEQWVKRDPVSNKIVAVDVTDMPIGYIIGTTSGTRLYVGVKIKPFSKAEDEKYTYLHDHVLGIVEKMLDYK